MTNDAARKREAAGRGLDWRFEWMRYAIRCNPQKPNVIATAAALAMRAHNRDLTIRLSAETIGAETGKQANHIESAHAALVRGGFLTWTGQWVDGMKVWWLTTPAVDVSDEHAVAVERRLSDRRGSLGEAEALPPDSSSTSPKLESDFPQTRGALPPRVGGRTDEVPASVGTRKVPTIDVVTDVDRRARERDSAPAVGPGYVAPLAEPRTEDGDGDPIGAAIVGEAAVATPEMIEATEEQPIMDCWYCGAMSDAPVCVDCDRDTEADLAEPHGAAHGASASADLPAPAAALLAALAERGPLPPAEVLSVVRAAGGRFPYEGTGPIIARDLAHRVPGPDGAEWVAYGPETADHPAPGVTGPGRGSVAPQAPSAPVMHDLSDGATIALAAVRSASPDRLTSNEVCAALRKAKDNSLYGDVLHELGRAGLIERARERGLDGAPIEKYGLPGVASPADEVERAAEADNPWLTLCRGLSA